MVITTHNQQHDNRSNKERTSVQRLYASSEDNADNPTECPQDRRGL